MCQEEKSNKSLKKSEAAIELGNQQLEVSTPLLTQPTPQLRLAALLKPQPIFFLENVSLPRLRLHLNQRSRYCNRSGLSH